MLKAKCPRCEATIMLPSEASQGEKVECPHCGCQCEVIWMYPLELGIVEKPLDQISK
jgi:lysine biosynthesis protein LysW